ncbi:MAG: site-specific integrase [Dechloromonas sp.]|nr:site-specific integrase [Dechloromonas sp.]
MTAWAEHEFSNLAPTTASRYADSLAKARPHLERLAIDEIDGPAIAALIAARKAEVSPATVRRDLTAVSSVLDYAEAQGWREGNPTLSKRRLIKERRDPIVLPEPADVESVIGAASRAFGALIRAARLTGCRQNELVTAQRRGFNRAADTLEVIGKGNKRRVIPLSDEASAHISAQPVALGSTLIFCREDGAPFSQAASDFTHLRRSLMGREAKAGRGFSRFRFHDLRHFYAVEYLRKGGSIYDLSKILGHTSVKTTEIYLEFLTPEEVERAKRGSAQNTAHDRRFGEVESA